RVEGVRAAVQVRRDRQLASALGPPEDARGRLDELADAVHVEEQPVGRAPRRRAAQPSDHAGTACSSGGASAWQIATARASAAWLGAGGPSRARIAPPN